MVLASTYKYAKQELGKEVLGKFVRVVNQNFWVG